jgi:PAS domain S-box-containing protein
MANPPDPTLIGADLAGELFASIVEHSFDAIVSKDLQGIVRTWNRGAETLLGWSSAEIVGKSIRVIIPADLLGEEDVVLKRIVAGEVVPKFETTRQHKNGKPVPLAITVSPLRNSSGRIIGASKIAHDISETLQIRAKLEESEKQFRMLANSIPQLAWMADANGSIFWYNDRWYEYTGTTIDQVQGWGWTAVHHPDHVARVKARIQQSWDSGQEWEDTFPLRASNGEYRWFPSRANPILDHQGNIWRWFGTNTDITLQREHENQIQLLMGEVSHRAKNMISIIQALVSRTADKRYAESLSQRLLALGHNQDMLAQRRWKGVPVGELITSQLAMVSDLLGMRIRLTGHLDLMLAPAAAEAIGLAIHELTTNAVKYGALSKAGGSVHIACSVIDGIEPGKFALTWQERCDIPISKPARKGFGTVMVERNPRFALGAEIDLDYPATGLVWRLTAPLDRVQAKL